MSSPKEDIVDGWKQLDHHEFFFVSLFHKIENNVVLSRTMTGILRSSVAPREEVEAPAFDRAAPRKTILYAKPNQVMETQFDVELLI